MFDGRCTVELAATRRRRAQGRIRRYRGSWRCGGGLVRLRRGSLRRNLQLHALRRRAGRRRSSLGGREPSLADIEAAYPTLTAIHRFDKAFAFVLYQAPVRGQRPAHLATGLNGVGVLAFPRSRYATITWIRRPQVLPFLNSRPTALLLAKSAVCGLGQNRD